MCASSFRLARVIKECPPSRLKALSTNLFLLLSSWHRTPHHMRVLNLRVSSTWVPCASIGTLKSGREETWVALLFLGIPDAVTGCGLSPSCSRPNGQGALQNHQPSRKTPRPAAAVPKLAKFPFEAKSRKGILNVVWKKMFATYSADPLPI